MILEHAKIMRNNTIFLPAKIREALGVKVSDIIVFSANHHRADIKRAPSSWHELAGLGKKVYAAYGGGEKYLRSERAGWSNKILSFKKKR